MIRESSIEFSRKLRRNSPDAENKLWQLLRSRNFLGFKFRRQQPIGHYIVDFCCLRARLIIELDGGQHLDRMEYDQRRTEYLESQGFQVLRFWDNEMFKETEGVLSKILAALEEPSPLPSPEKGEGEVKNTL